MTGPAKERDKGGLTEPPDPLNSAVRDFVLYLRLDRGLSVNTADGYQRDLLSFAAFLRCAGLTRPQDIDGELLLLYLASQRQAGLSPATLARRGSSIRGFSQWLKSSHMIAHDFCARLSSPRSQRPLPQVLTVAEMDKLLTAADTAAPRGLRDQAMLEIGYGCGLRVSELIGLTVHDLVREEGVLRCFGKGGKERLIPLGQYAEEALDAYLAQGRPQLLRGKRTQELFLNRLGDKLSRSGWYRILDGYGQRLGLDLHPHILRHSAATHMLDNGADLRIVQEFLGHNNIATTQIYVNLSRSELKSAYLRFHPRRRMEGME